MSKASSDLLEQLCAEFEKTAKLLGFDDSTAFKVAASMAYTLDINFSGEQIYFPKRSAFKKRNAEIKQAFNGSNHQDICCQFQISLSTLYRILN